MDTFLSEKGTCWTVIVKGEKLCMDKHSGRRPSGRWWHGCMPKHFLHSSKPITMDWFTGLMCNNHNKCYIWPHKLFFYFCMVCICIIFKCVCGLHDVTWLVMVWKPLLWNKGIRKWSVMPRLHAIDKLSKDENLNPIFVPSLTFIIDSVAFLVSLR